MDIAGIVCEFDPFHNGHAYLLNKVRKQGASGIVCVMSGDFVQRGGPALCDKFLSKLCGLFRKRRRADT